MRICFDSDWQKESGNDKIEPPYGLRMVLNINTPDNSENYQEMNT